MSFEHPNVSLPPIIQFLYCYYARLILLLHTIFSKENAKLLSLIMYLRVSTIST